MRLDPILTEIDSAIEAQLRLADPAVAETAAGFMDAFRPAVRSALLEVAQQVAAEIGAQLGDSRVDVRLVAGDPELVVTPTPPPPPPSGDRQTSTVEDNDLEARITLRLPGSLKGLIEDAASTSGDSINSWVVNALRSRARRSNVGSHVEETFEL
jgi:hypothetical protein